MGEDVENDPATDNVELTLEVKAELDAGLVAVEDKPAYEIVDD